MFGFLKRKKQERSAEYYVNDGWIGTNTFPAGYNSVPAVRQALTLYSSFLSEAKIVGDPEFLDLIHNPNPWDSKTTFFKRIVHSFFLDGNFIAEISKKDGRTILLPYQPNYIYAYAKDGDLIDSHELIKQNYYYQDYRGRRFPPDKILHIKDPTFSYDLINARSRVQMHLASLLTEAELIQTQKIYSENRLGKRIFIDYFKSQTTMPKATGDRERGFESIRNFHRSNGMILLSPEKANINPTSISADNPAALLSTLKKCSTEDIANAFCVPPELLTLSDATSGTGLKEGLRFWVKTGLQEFLNIIAESLDPLSMTEVKFELGFNQRVSEIREFTPLLKALASNEIDEKTLNKMFGF